MSAPQTIPYTPLLARMREMPSSRSQRLCLAEALAADSTALVTDLLASVHMLEEFDRVEQPFCGPRPDLQRDLDQVAHRERALRTADVAFWLQSRGHLGVAMEPQLDCRYVDRELVPTRGARGRGQPRAPALRVDLLMVNAGPLDRTPVVAEVKIGADKDPFAALLQALAGLAQLATVAQYRRLLRAYPRAGFSAHATPPPMDAYVMWVDPIWEAPLMAELLIATRQIAHNLSHTRATADIIRRAVLLALVRRPGELWSEAERL